MRPKTGISIRGQTLAQALQSVNLLADVEVLVGFPEDTTERDADPDDPMRGITNAALAYIHDNGAPERNIPARPFMDPAMQEAEEPLADALGRMAAAALGPNSSAVVEQQAHRLGLIAKLAVQNKINEGIPPPLAPRTLKARALRGRTGTKPLIDTGQLRNAANYVIRSRRKRKN
jgi:hypothetical protein